MKLRPARSSGPIAGGVGVTPLEQHDGYMMFAWGFGTLTPSVCVWPSPIAWPISWVSTREKLSDFLNDVLKSAAFWKMTTPREKPLKATPLTVPPAPPPKPLPPPMASVDPLNLVVRILERDHGARRRQARPRPGRHALHGRAAVLKDDGCRRGRIPRGQRRLDLADGIAAQKRVGRADVLVQGIGVAESACTHRQPGDPPRSVNGCSTDCSAPTRGARPGRGGRPVALAVGRNRSSERNGSRETAPPTTTAARGGCGAACARR